ncbi:MAG: GLUG motif-containing protein [Dysosmobacter sp.]
MQDFVQFSKQCTRDTWSRGITVELTADLDLSDQAITPVPIFQGTFHGNGHTISGLSLETKGSKMGLFRTLSASAVVEDLTVEGTLCPQGSANQAGLLAGENFGTVRRCTVRGSVTGQEDIGGLVGYNGESGSLISCSSAADVTGVYNVGGIAGENLGTVERCSNTGSLNVEADQDTPTNVGGIAGLSRGTIRGCSNTGPVGYQHVGYNMGGIAGLQSGEISECTNTGPIQGRKDVGGIAGQFEPYTSLTYGPSPSQQLADSMSGLFDQLDRFATQVNDMVSREQRMHRSFTTHSPPFRNVLMPPAARDIRISVTCPTRFTSISPPSVTVWIPCSPTRIGSVTMPETPSRRLWINPTLCSMSWSSWPRRRTAA